MTKKILTIVLLIVMYASGFSQTEKGARIISIQGNVQFDKETSKIFSSSNGIKAGAQWLIKDNLAFGGTLLSSLPGARHYSLEAGPVIRQYFNKLDIKPYLEVALGMDYRSYHSHDEYEPFLKPGAGLIYWFHKNIGIDTNLNFDLISSPAEVHWNFGVNVSFF